MRTALMIVTAFLICAVQVMTAEQHATASNNGPKATLIHAANLYVAADTASTRMAEIEPGRELVVMERSGPWVRVFANTDTGSANGEDAPVLSSETAAPISGWMQAAGVISSETPNGDAILFGVAAEEEIEASQPHAPPNTAETAHLLYQSVVNFFPQSPLVPEAMWRAADIAWQLHKAEVFSLPSAREKEAYLREQIDETDMRKLKKKYPNSRYEDLAAWDMLDNKICGDWQGSTQCPEKEASLYETYALDHPQSPKAAEALYNAAYREGVLTDMYASNGDEKRAEQSKAKGISLAQAVESKYSQSDYAARAGALVYKLQQSIPIYGIDRQ